MEGSRGIGVGFMAVFAVSGSAVLIALQLHKRLLSDYMKKIESEIGGPGNNYQRNKRVRFADTVVEPSSNNKEYRQRHRRKAAKAGRVQSMKKREDDNTMPLNRRILYQGIIEYKTLRGHRVSNCF